MNVEINGATYEVPQAVADKLINDIVAVAIAKYNSLDSPMIEKFKIGGQMLVRGALKFIEDVARKQYGKEVSLQFRPPPKCDPTVWALQTFLPTMKKELEHVTLSCQIDVTTNTATAFSLSVPSKGSSRRQVDTTGDIGLRENNRT